MHGGHDSRGIAARRREESKIPAGGPRRVVRHAAAEPTHRAAAHGPRGTQQRWSVGARCPGTANLLRRRLMTQRSDPLVDRGQLAWRGSGVHNAGRLEEHQVTFFRRVRAMLGVSGDYEELAGTEGDVLSISELNGDVPGEDQEHLVDLMLMPDELTARLYELELPAVRLRDDLGRPVLGEATELLRDVDCPAASTCRDRLGVLRHDRQPFR